MSDVLFYYADRMRHLVCVPYSVENLHVMAADLDINRCWFHNGTYPHYDIPKRRVQEILDTPKVNVVPARRVLEICKFWESPHPCIWCKAKSERDDCCLACRGSFTDEELKQRG